MKAAGFLSLLGLAVTILSALPPAQADEVTISAEGTAKATGTPKSGAPFSGSVQSAPGHRPRIGLALGGGGARGAAHVGVLKVFQEEGIPIDMIAGTSIGSVVGGLYASGVTLDELSDRFADASLMKAFMTVPLPVRLFAEPILFTPRLFGAHPYDGLYKGKKFRVFANRLADPGERNIEQLSIPFAAVCTDLVDGKAYRITKGSLSLALQASTAVPGLRKPVQIGDHLYCDGGLVCNVPVSKVKEMGADFIIAVDIDERLNPVPLDTFRHPGSVTKQAIKIQLADIDSGQNAHADFVIHPNTDGISLISRKKSDGQKGLEAGIAAARACMPELKRKLTALGVDFSDPRSATTPNSRPQ